jgi:hypothetical protein
LGRERVRRETKNGAAAPANISTNDALGRLDATFLAKNIQLSPEDEAALKQRGSLKLPACGEEVGWTDRVADATADYVMHREESEQGLDEKTRAELASKRQEILDRLRKLRGEANEGP